MRPLLTKGILRRTYYFRFALKSPFPHPTAAVISPSTALWKQLPEKVLTLFLRFLLFRSYTMSGGHLSIHNLKNVPFFCILQQFAVFADIQFFHDGCQCYISNDDTCQPCEVYGRQCCQTDMCAEGQERNGCQYGNACECQQYNGNGSTACLLYTSSSCAERVSFAMVPPAYSKSERLRLR